MTVSECFIVARNRRWQMAKQLLGFIKFCIPTKAELEIGLIVPIHVHYGEETLHVQARNATVSKTLITPTPNTTHTNPQVHGGF